MSRVSLLLVLALWLPAAPALAGEALWSLLERGGLVVLMRHASTPPMTGDPPGFRLEDCSTQRNLTDAGRDEARRVGAAFRSRRVPVDQVLSSRWCRCLETARLVFGAAEPWPILDNLLRPRGRDAAREAEQTQAARARIAAWRGPGNLVLVTHGVNILPLTGFVPVMGELVVVTPRAPDGFTVVGRLAAYAM